MPKPEDLRIGDNLSVIYVGGEKKHYKVTGIDEVFLKDVHAPLATATTESYTNITYLDPPTGQLIWIGGIEMDGNVELQIKQPAATNRWGTNKSPTGGYLLDIQSPITDARKIDLWIAKDYMPAVQLVNNTPVTINPILWWIGRRFSVIEQAKEPVPTTLVKIGGLAD